MADETIYKDAFKTAFFALERKLLEGGPSAVANGHADFTVEVHDGQLVATYSWPNQSGSLNAFAQHVGVFKDIATFLGKHKIKAEAQMVVSGQKVPCPSAGSTNGYFSVADMYAKRAKLQLTVPNELSSINALRKVVEEMEAVAPDQLAGTLQEQLIANVQGLLDTAHGQLADMFGAQTAAKKLNGIQTALVESLGGTKDAPSKGCARA